MLGRRFFSHVVILVLFIYPHFGAVYYNAHQVGLENWKFWWRGIFGTFCLA